MSKEILEQAALPYPEWVTLAPRAQSFNRICQMAPMCSSTLSYSIVSADVTFSLLHWLTPKSAPSKICPFPWGSFLGDTLQPPQTASRSSQLFLFQNSRSIELVTLRPIDRQIDRLGPYRISASAACTWIDYRCHIGMGKKETKWPLILTNPIGPSPKWCVG